MGPLSVCLGHGASLAPIPPSTCWPRRVRTPPCSPSCQDEVVDILTYKFSVGVTPDTTPFNNHIALPAGEEWRRAAYYLCD